jgi:hypothetical protein
LQNKKLRFELEFIAENRPIASSIRGIVVCSIKQQHRLNRGPPKCLLPQQGLHRPRHPLGRYYRCMKAIRYAWQDETDRPSYQRIGQSTSSCPATRGLQLQVPDESANNAHNEYNTYNKYNVYNSNNTYNRYNNLIGLSLRFESHIPENVVDQMNDILVQHEDLIHDSSFDRVTETKQCNWSSTC